MYFSLSSVAFVTDMGFLVGLEGLDDSLPRVASKVFKAAIQSNFGGVGFKVTTLGQILRIVTWFPSNFPSSSSSSLSSLPFTSGGKMTLPCAGSIRTFSVAKNGMPRMTSCSRSGATRNSAGLVLSHDSDGIPTLLITFLLTRTPLEFIGSCTRMGDVG